MRCFSLRRKKSRLNCHKSYSDIYDKIWQIDKNKGRRGTNRQYFQGEKEDFG